VDKLKYASEIKRLGSKLREIREARNLTQQSIASLCDIDVRSVQRIEKGEQNITINLLLTLADVLEINPAELVQFSTE